jgi:hypothetical protein
MKTRPNPVLLGNNSNVVLDMYHSSVQAPNDPNLDEYDDRLIVDRETIEAMKRALKKAMDLGIIEVPTRRRQCGKRYGVTTRVEVKEEKNSRDRRSYFQVAMTLRWPDDDSAMTEITASFGRDDTSEWFSLQGNPTSTLTGQNTWPMQLEFKPEHQPTMMFAWPYMTFLAICRAADLEFKAPSSLVKRILRGGMTLQNAQFASYLQLPVADKTTFFALVGTAFRAPRVRARKEGGLEAFDLGDRLNIKALPYEPALTDDGIAPWASLMLCKKSGKNPFATLTFYDKAAKEKFTPAETAAEGLDDLIRADITLQTRGFEFLFSSTKKLADQRSEDLKFDLNANGKTVATVSNIVKAIEFLDLHYKCKIGKRTSLGFRSWLLNEIVRKQFHLREILGWTPRRWERVESWMSKWALKDFRYEIAFDRWRNAETENVSLYACLTGAGFHTGTAAERIKELEKMRLSDNIPPYYWINRRTIARSWGFTDDEEVEFWRLADLGKDTSVLEQVRETRLADGMKAARRVINRAHVVESVRSVPLAGMIEVAPKFETESESQASKSKVEVPARKPITSWLDPRIFELKDE